MEVIKELNEIGFIKIGEWKLNNGLFLDLKLNQKANSFLYAFCNEDEVFYVGHTYERMVSKRLYHYEKVSGKSGSTNKRINEKICGYLSNNKLLDIFCFSDNGNDTYKNTSLRMNIAAGLELSLIFYFRASWNIQGKKLYVATDDVIDMGKQRYKQGQKQNSEGQLICEIKCQIDGDEYSIRKYANQGRNDNYKVYINDNLCHKTITILRKLAQDLKLELTNTEHTNTCAAQVIKQLEEKQNQSIL